MTTEPTEEELKQAEKEIRKEDSHVAYLKYLSNHEGITWLELADSTETGAFRVYHEKDFLSERAEKLQLQAKHAQELCSMTVQMQQRNMKIIELQSQLAAKEAEIGGLRKNYHELLFAVGKKYPNESRHETALRYIVESERRGVEGAEKSSQLPTEQEKG